MLPTGPYTAIANQDPEFRRIMRRLHNARTKTVVHHETCPCCGAKLVNLYRKDIDSGEWKCKKCWDKTEEAADSLIENDTPRCETCQVHSECSNSPLKLMCKWYVQNVVNGDKSVKSCPNYKPVEVDSNG